MKSQNLKRTVRHRQDSGRARGRLRGHRVRHKAAGKALKSALWGAAGGGVVVMRLRGRWETACGTR